MWSLRIVTDGVPERTFRLLTGSVRTIGRATGADFILDEALVSRVHCRLKVLPDGQLEVSDLESTNGTYVNGQRIERALLVPGDRLQVGRVELIAHSDTENETTDRPRKG
jgi:ABC transport system ATP-binding/permease protein